MKLVRVTVHRARWDTVRDSVDRLRHCAVVELDTGIALRSVRISKEKAQQLLDAGAELVDDTKGIDKAELKRARTAYFAAGGLESDIGPRDDARWYWRRAAKLCARKA